MSISYSGTFTRSAGIISALYKQLKQVNLKPVKKIQVQFDPFHPQAVTAREFLYHINTPYVQDTNLNCLIKANVVCDRSEPEIKIDLLDSGTIKILANNLTVLEILQQINKHISSKVKVEEVQVLQTKSAKSSAGGKKTRR
ncbi:39S ribosomal protein L53, mitochondrial [Anthonomus grandis grandis]|uniref:39S ribosomal protein L53, mitochondrial n=1 Tax=Anthonomus grandis grandis TaxID=2921223 RepID=UPI002165E0CA|nr:39S ribosomal protein L53, mitochondrial [Anthonomus grandis grandis]